MTISTDRKKLLLGFIKRNSLKCKDISIINQAFIHRSFSNETGVCHNNERLEFLGDSILGAVTASLLYKIPGDKSEGELAKVKSAVVSERVLSGIARELELDKLLILGKGEEGTGGRTRKSLLADALEALFGAVYLDSGFKKVFAFVSRLIEPEIVRARDHGAYTDYKSRLQEITMQRYKQYPVYRLAKRVGPEHERFFWVNVIVNGVAYGPGVGKNKNSAEQEAAKNACSELEQKGDTQELKSLMFPVVKTADRS
jgi:ribonuclease-3